MLVVGNDVALYTGYACTSAKKPRAVLIGNQKFGDQGLMDDMNLGLSEPLRISVHQVI